MNVAFVAVSLPIYFPALYVMLELLLWQQSEDESVAKNSSETSFLDLVGFF